MNKTCSLRQIDEAVSRTFSVPVDAIHSEARQRTISDARQACMWHAEKAGFSTASMSKHWNRSISKTRCGIKSAQDKADTEKSYKLLLEISGSRIQHLTPSPVTKTETKTENE